jgi:ribulose 1,5-bisphosphate carboxylase large subunit-like protein
LKHDLTKAELRDILVERDSIEKDDFFVLKLHVVPNENLTLEEAAVRILLILTGRTMIRLPYETPDIRKRSNGHILGLDVQAKTVEIALPRQLCSAQEGLTHLFTLLCSAAEYNYTREFWVDNIDFPTPFVSAYPGPRFGIAGLRHQFGPSAQSRPLIGIIFKPRAGVPLARILPLLREALIGGCDFIADDLLLVDREGEAPFAERVQAVTRMIRELSTDLGTPKGYFVNIGTDVWKAAKLADQAIAFGASGLVLNGFTMGFGSMAELIDHVDGRVPTITANMGGGILTRPRLLTEPGKPTGVSETVISKFSRIAGADAVHAGTSASECYGGDAWGPATRALRSPFFTLKPVFAVAEGDLNIANLWENIRSLGRDVILEPTSGILAAPGGPRQAAAIFRALAARLSDDMSEEEAAKTIDAFAQENRALKVAAMLDHFGYIRPGK